jgi:hypothetical protein
MGFNSFKINKKKEQVFCLFLFYEIICWINPQ